MTRLTVLLQLMLLFDLVVGVAGMTVNWYASPISDAVMILEDWLTWIFVVAIAATAVVGWSAAALPVAFCR